MIYPPPLPLQPKVPDKYTKGGFVAKISSVIRAGACDHQHLPEVLASPSKPGYHFAWVNLTTVNLTSLPKMTLLLSYHSFW